MTLSLGSTSKTERCRWRSEKGSKQFACGRADFEMPKVTQMELKDIFGLQKEVRIQRDMPYIFWVILNFI